MGLFDKLLSSSDKRFNEQTPDRGAARLTEYAEKESDAVAKRFEDMKKPVASLLHMDGIPKMTPQEAVTVFADSEKGRLEIKSSATEKAIYLSYSQISAAGIVSDADIRSKDKSVIGRAAIGGLVLGPVGAIVGGLSGTGEKHKNVLIYYYVLNYHPSNSPENVKAIKFRIPGLPDDVYYLNSEIQKEIQSGEEEYL